MVWSGVTTPAWLSLAVDEGEHRVGGAEFDNKTAPGALDLLVLLAARAPHDRRDRGEVGMLARRRCGHSRRFAPLRDEGLRKRHHFDHALIGFARGGAESDDAVLAQDQPVARLDLLEHLDRLF